MQSETFNQFLQQAVTKEEFLDHTKRFLKSLETLNLKSSEENSYVELVETIQACLNTSISPDDADLVAFELLGPCLRALAVIPRTFQLSEKLSSLCDRCLSLGKPKELFLVVIDEVLSLRSNSKCFFSRVFPLFLSVSISFLRESKNVFFSDIETILKILDIGWNTELVGETTFKFLDERGRDCKHFLKGFFTSVCKLTISVLSLIKFAVLERKFVDANCCGKAKFYLIRVVLDIISWVSLFFSDVFIFDTNEKEEGVEKELWEYNVSLVNVLRDLSMHRRLEIFGLSKFLEDATFQHLLVHRFQSDGSLSELAEELKKEPCSFLSIGCYLFTSFILSPLEEDCFLDSKVKLDLYLPPIAALFQSKWTCHKAIALRLCREVLSDTLECFSGVEVLQLLQPFDCRHFLSANNSHCDCYLLAIFGLLLRCFESTTYQKVSCQVINTCVYHLREPLMRWEVVYFCLMTSTVIGVKAQMVHELKETLLNIENDNDASKVILSTSQVAEKQDLWNWLADFLFATFLTPRLSFIQELPLVSSSVHILAFIFWRMKRGENVFGWKKRMERRAKDVRTILSRILDQLHFPSQRPSFDAPVHIPQEVRNRICNGSLLCISLLDQTLLS